MKRNEGKYPLLEKLPKKAQTVREYAAKEGITQTAVYMRLLRGTADFEIKIFKGMNFVIEK